MESFPGSSRQSLWPALASSWRRWPKARPRLTGSRAPLSVPCSSRSPAGVASSCRRNGHADTTGDRHPADTYSPSCSDRNHAAQQGCTADSNISGHHDRDAGGYRHDTDGDGYRGAHTSAASNCDSDTHGHTATATPLPTATPSPTPQVAPTLAPARDFRLQFAADDWVGGYYRGDSQTYGRPWSAVYGAMSDYPRATLGFTLDATPGRAATLSITGLDDEWQSLNPVALEVNGQAVFSGSSPFLNWDGVGNGANAAWTTVTFTIPNGILRAGPNEITFANLSPVASFNAPPYVLLADAALEISAGATGAPTSVPIVPSNTAGAFTAADWVGAYYRGDSQFYGRPWSAIYGTASQYPRATIRFRLDARPSGPATLTLTGLDDELAELNPIAIEVNDQQVFSGPSPFRNWNGAGNGADAAWTQVTVTIPADVLKRGRNEITIANLSPSGNFNAPPYVLLADATLEAPGASVTPLTQDASRR